MKNGDATEKKDIESKGDCSKDLSEKLKFKWTQEVPQYGDKLLRRLDEFRKKNMFYDVMLKTTDDDLAAHKVVLAACGGMFRSHFIDAKTKRISSDVTEVSFSCPAAGLRPILKFAYSGLLEINQNNLLPTLIAATITEMKEVREICADLAISRLGWLLTFDGSTDSLTNINLEGATNKKQEISATLEQAYMFLHKHLETNSVNFPNKQSPSKKNGEVSEEDESVSYPCLKEVETKWPDLKDVYKAIIECLHKIDHKEKPAEVNIISRTKDDSKKKESSESEKEVPQQKIDDSDQNETKETPTKPEEISTDAKSQETKPSSTPIVSESEVLPSAKEERPTPLVRKTSSKESPKPPVCKPRTVSIQTHTRNLSNGSNEKKKPSPSLPRDNSKSMSSGSVASKTPQKLTTPSSAKLSSSPVPPRRKHAAPKPPGPPPTKSASSNKPTSVTETPTKNQSHPQVGRATPTSASKVPPPRPKPPTVHKKAPEVKHESNGGATGDYDDTLNPFADDEESGEESKPSGEDASNIAKSEEPDYDESLNPFG